MTHFIFDCDDVLLDWQTGFLNYVRKCGINPDPSGPEEWDMTTWLNTTPQYVRKLVRDFNDSSAFDKLNAMPHAKDVIWALNDAGHTCSVLTACGDHHVVRSARYHNLSVQFNKPRMGGEHFAFTQIAFLPLGSSKFDTLYKESKRFSDLVFVEDNFQHAQSAAVNGIKAYCIRKRHNRHDEATREQGSRVIWINDISEVV